MNLSKEDRTGLAISAGFHLVVLVLLAWLSVSAAETQPMGFLEVEFGPFSEGRPVRQASVQNQPEPQPQEEQPEQERRTPVAPPENVKPVELPDADQRNDVADETVDTPDAEVIAPEKSTTKAEKPDETPQEAREVVRPLGSGALTREDGADTGDEGKSNQEQASAPYQIEGLNRETVSAPLPAIVTQSGEVRMTVRIKVDPRGNVVRVVPTRRGDPDQDRQVMQVVRQWRFNALPSNAPQVNQDGTITFVFRRR
ncbi:MAG: TonB family protein [Bacteroidetes bacterium]|nr:TonB family protein [Bacteroidota bacterium]